VLLIAVSATHMTPASSSLTHASALRHDAELRPWRRAWCANRCATEDVSNTRNPHCWNANRCLARGRGWDGIADHSICYMRTHHVD